MVCQKEAKLWGGYEVIHGDASRDCSKPNSITKVLTVEPGTATSLQSHVSRVEQWTVIEGELYVEVLPENGCGICKILKPGDHITIPRNAIHRFTNFSEERARFIEVQTGECCEDDIIRYVKSCSFLEV